MKEQLVSIAEYIESLEQRIAALEERLENLEKPEPLEKLESLEPLDAPSPTPEPEPEPEPELDPEPIHPTPEPSLFGPQVDNIRQAISLGDRFLFQRELFSNNGELMQKTLDELDVLANLGEAEQYIARFNWDQESTTYKLFLNVLKRRF